MSQPSFEPVQTQPSAPAVPGQKLLKVTSILFIIFGGLSLLISSINLVSVHAHFNAAGIIFIILDFGSSIAIGIIGLKKYTDPAFGLFYIISGSVLIPWEIICLVMIQSSITNGTVSGGIGIAGIVLPILYIVGGAKKNKAAKAVH